MRNQALTAAVKNLFQLPRCPKLALILTGGGISGLQTLLTCPGASVCVLDAYVPYSYTCLHRILATAREFVYITHTQNTHTHTHLYPQTHTATHTATHTHTHTDRPTRTDTLRHTDTHTHTHTPAAVCGQTALLMAYAALHKATCVYWTEFGLEKCPSVLMGVSCTAALATTKPKQGDHRAHVCVSRIRSDGTISAQCCDVLLEKGVHERFEEDVIVGDVLVNLILSQVDNSEWKMSHAHGYSIAQSSTFDIPVYEDFFKNRFSYIYRAGESDAFMPTNPTHQRPHTIIIPGSFNPLHEGHIQLGVAAKALVKRHTHTQGEPQVVYEMSVTNADKGCVSQEEVTNRLQSFKERKLNVLLTHMPLFKDKIRAFKGTFFVVGFDTFRRMLDCKYYRGGVEDINDFLKECLLTQCTFVVAGRVDHDQYRTYTEAVDDVVPVGVDKNLVAAVFCGLKEFRVDISSTEIRAGHTT